MKSTNIDVGEITGVMYLQNPLSVAATFQEESKQNLPKPFHVLHDAVRADVEVFTGSC